MVLYFDELLSEKWTYDGDGYHEKGNLVDYDVYYHDETRRKKPFAIEEDGKEGYYYLVKEYVPELRLFVSKGEFIVTDQPLGQEKQDELHVVRFEEPFDFVRKYNYQEKEEVDYGFCQHAEDGMFVIKILELDSEMQNEEYDEFLADLNALFNIKRD